MKMRVDPNDIFFNDKCGTTVYSDANIFKVFLDQQQNSHLKPPYPPPLYTDSKTYSRTFSIKHEKFPYFVVFFNKV